MKYIANPVEVDAHKITAIAIREESGLPLKVEEIGQYFATNEMLSRIFPEIGDYLVIQSDGYAYLNPKNVFERKYSPKAETVTA